MQRLLLVFDSFQNILDIFLESVPIFSFALFRIFDIWKPQPIRYFDKLDSPYGVMMDDVIAGLLSAIILTIIFLIFY